MNPKDGKPVVTPSQDMVLGNYYLTLERKDAMNTGTIFNDTNEVLKAYANGYVHLHTRIGVHAKSFNNPTFTEAQNNKILATSVGKVIFNEIILIHSHSSMNLVKQILKVKHLTNTLLIQLNWVKVDLKHTLKNKNLLNHSIKILR